MIQRELFVVCLRDKENQMGSEACLRTGLVDKGVFMQSEDRTG